MNRRVNITVVAFAFLLLTACSAAHPPYSAPVAPASRSLDEAGSGQSANNIDDETRPPVSSKKSPILIDDASVLIREATEEYQIGEAAYKNGDLDAARQHFDEAVLKYLQSDLPVLQEPRLREAYTRLLEDIQSLDSDALGGADGEEPGPREETPVDELKDITTFLTPEELALEMKKIRPPSDADHFSIPIVLNERVLTFIDAFQNQFRKPFSGGYQRMGRYEEMIRNTFREEGLPEDLIYIGFIESTFKPNAFSRARAKGIWQFMASTGSRYGLARNAYVDERSDPEKATRAAARYLKDLYAMFGDWYLVMASYNAGEGIILRAIERTGKRDFWELAKTRYLQTETKNFVPSILALSIMSRDPARYGHDGLVKDPALVFDKVALDGPTDLNLIARLCGTSVDDIRALNPQLTRGITPPGYRSYEIRVPAGTGASFTEAYASLPASVRIAPVRASYRVRRGDTLAGVARRFGTSAAVLAEANGIGLDAKVASGMKLVVPGGVEPMNDRPPRPSTRRGSSGTYVVRRGDTLSGIARSRGMTPDRLAAMNGFSTQAVLRPGQRLILSVPEAAQGTRVTRAGTSGGADNGSAASQQRVAYKVRSGDSLYAIAQKYGTTVASLKAWNKLASSARIYPGDVLTIYVN